MYVGESEMHFGKFFHSHFISKIVFFAGQEGLHHPRSLPRHSPGAATQGVGGKVLPPSHGPLEKVASRQEAEADVE